MPSFYGSIFNSHIELVLLLVTIFSMILQLMVGIFFHFVLYCYVIFAVFFMYSSLCMVAIYTKLYTYLCSKNSAV